MEPATTDSSATPDLVGALARTTGPRIETSVVAMTLRGIDSLDVLTAPDLDIVERIDGTRFLPLVRILRVLGIEPRDSASVLVFTPDGAPIVTADYGAQTVSIGRSSAKVPMVVGISDVTNQPEVYVEESALAAMLSMDVVWDPRLYAYDIRARRMLSVFKRLHERGRRIGMSSLAAYDLPGHLPPARAHRSLLPYPQFLEAQWQSSLDVIRPGQGVERSFPVPRVGLWADVLDGNLGVRVNQNTSSNTPGYKTEQLLWNTSFNQTSLSVGSVNLGLSELVFPSLSLIGAVASGRLGSTIGSDDPSQMGRQQAFMPLYAFEGYARLGSEVTLSINGEDVETRRVESGPNSPPGDGPYRFEGVNLFPGRLNDVRIHIAAPDGSVEEIRHRVLGTNQLMEPGDLAFIGGVGGERDPTSDAYSASGRFSGGRINYGIGRRLMLGVSAAHQERLYDRQPFSNFGDSTLSQPPSRSTHLGSRLAWQPVDPLLVSVEAAGSQTGPDSAASFAVRADADYQFGGLRVHPTAFRYGPTFFDGQYPEQRDLTGAGLGFTLRSRKGDQLGIGASRMRDDLEGRGPQALRWTESQASVSIHGIIPRSVVTLGGRRIWFTDAPALLAGQVGLTGTLPWGVSLRGRHDFGDDIKSALQSRDPGNSAWRFDYSSRASSPPDAGSDIGVGSYLSSLELRRQLGRVWQLSLTDGTVGVLHRSSIDLSRSVSANGFWQARSSPGYDWGNHYLVLQNRAEFFLRGNRNNRLVLEHQLVHHDWSVRLSIQLQMDAGFVGTRPVPLLDSQLDPSRGGVKGRVFLDANGNGLPDPGEPGIAGIQVVTEDGRTVESGRDGLFVISSVSSLRATRVSLQPEALPATYSLTQATQEALLRPGEFTEVNLGVATLGSLSGSITKLPEPGDQARKAGQAGVAGVRVVLTDEAGKEAGDSITGSDGVFTIGDIRPGHYTLRPDKTTSPADLLLEPHEIPIEVKSSVEPFERADLSFTGHYLDSAARRRRVEEHSGVEYKLFSAALDSTAAPGSQNPAPSQPGHRVSALPEPVATTAPMSPEPTRAKTSDQPSPASPGNSAFDSRVLVAYGHRVSPPPQAPVARDSTCNCQVEGTIEVQSEQPLNRPVMVTVSLLDAPAHRDSVELSMGPPRFFSLGRVPCGRHDLLIRTSTPKRFTAVEPNPATFECVPGRTRELHVVLEPR